MDRHRLKRAGGHIRPAIDLDDVIYGVHAVDEALAAGEPLRHLHISNDRKRDPAVKKIIDQANEREVRVRFEDRSYFTQFPYKAHQGVIAFGPPFAYAGLDDVLSKRERTSPLLLVILDHITDPHNAGAIIRTAECAGADAVVIPDRRAAGVNATVRKAAAGAAAHLPVVRVANIADTIRKLKKANVWVAGAAITPESVEYSQADLARDIALVIGAEDEGLTQLVRRECDYLIRIPVLGRAESLNASVAAAILLYEAVRQRRAAALAP
ncbi:MAG TPA: 23S rRNA (guanosine(2251)-2'-O)-methyltransferase RlmB [Candidatus Baltobacteraceae bacterium]|jgi:23S rRNA (guanosine2251-2'-O)-methyltransferase|nr:23S rRNA (guanosine(2251)-2'-O)-methyltransferase RlmB [Candidatus Baltobacteraceae bacterium]